MKWPWHKEPVRPLTYTYHDEVTVEGDPSCEHLWMEDLPWIRGDAWGSRAHRCIDCGRTWRYWTTVE